MKSISMSHTISPIASSWAVQKSIKPISKKTQTSLYEKLKDELDIYAIQSKKKDFFNCLELFYQHNGLNRKDKLEKLLK